MLVAHTPELLGSRGLSSYWSGSVLCGLLMFDIMC